MITSGIQIPPPPFFLKVWEAYFGNKCRDTQILWKVMIQIDLRQQDGSLQPQAAHQKFQLCGNVFGLQ